MSSFNGVDGSIASQTFTATTTWQRFSHTATVTTTNSWYPCIPSVSGAQLYIWGAQLERGSSVTDYYATTSTAKTRGTTWTDLSIGGGNNGTLVNGVGYSNGTLSFDGVNDYVSTGLVLPSPSTTPTTFDLIFKYNSTNSFRGLIGSSAYQSAGFSVGFMGQSSIRMTYNASSLSYEPSWSYDSSIISNGTFVFNGRNISGYRNGSLISTYTASFDAALNSNGMQIGRNLQGGWGTSQVDVYAVRVYNKALTALEVQQNFNATRGRFGI